MKKLFSVWICSFLFTHSFAQVIDSTLTKYANDFSQERIYLHYDKSTYAPGETVWFKIYMMKTIFPAEDTRTVYIDWSDEKGTLLLHALSPVQGGTSFGQFDIPREYAGQYLHVKAYTKWMLNFDTAFLYQNDLRILSKTSAVKAPKSMIVPELNFFPEGGDAVEGVTNKIAFKANDQYGRPVKIKGDIVSSKGSVVDQLRIIHDGMGYFFVRPQDGESFSADWEDEKGIRHNTPLPKIKSTGVSLQVTTSGTKRNFLVSASPSFTDTSQLHIVGTMYQQEVFNITKDLKGGMLEGIIPTGSLPSGILTITVFSSKWNPLAERITYVNNEEYRFEPKITVQHWGLNKRSRNEIEISIPDSLSASLSLSVTDLGIDTDTSDNIISHLLLSGEIKGRVNNPSYYFLNTSDSISQQLDLVMLTHGWRRFDWEKVVKGVLPVIKYKPDTAYLTISGKIFGATPSQLRSAGQIILMVNQKKAGMQVYTVPVEGNGYFNDPALLLFDTARIYYQLPKTKGLGDVSVQFMQDRLPPFSHNTRATGQFYNQLSDTTGNYYHLRLSDALEQELKYLKGKVLATVNVKARPKFPTEEMDKKYTSGLFSGGDSYEFDLVNDPFALSSQDIFQYLQGKVAGLQINSTSNPPTLTWRGGTPTLFINEMESTPDMLSSMPVSDVAYIKVFRPPFMGAFGGGANGAVAIYTRQGGDVKSEPGKGLANNVVSGYTAIRQFYSPDYDTASLENDKKDLRTTLYWNPAVNLRPGTSKVTLSFFNNDITDAFRVVIEGMTTDGRLAHIVQTME